MKIAIIGAGAIGGYVAVKLALAGEDVTVIVRGANLAAIRENGMKLIMHDGTRTRRPRHHGHRRLRRRPARRTW